MNNESRCTIRQNDESTKTHVNSDFVLLNVPLPLGGVRGGLEDEARFIFLEEGSRSMAPTVSYFVGKPQCKRFCYLLA
jgi:hypothetical protein